MFLGGVALLLFTFKMALELFTTPPQQALGIQTGKDLDVSKAGSNLVGILIRILLLLVMAFVGSMIANRGIGMYSACSGQVREMGSDMPEDVARFAGEGGSGG